MNYLFQKAIYYRTYRPTKQSALYNVDVAHELHYMAKKTALQTKESTFSGKDPMPVIAFLLTLKQPATLVKYMRGNHCGY